MNKKSSKQNMVLLSCDAQACNRVYYAVRFFAYRFFYYFMQFKNEHEGLTVA